MSKNKPKAYSYKRFSSREQDKGDSLRRQSAINAEQIANSLGMPLDDSLNLVDKGFSAYKGAHITKGAFGQFLKHIDDGSIAPGSVLIIETLDRMSREAIIEAISLMTTILKKDVGIYTCMDEQYYTKENFDFTKLVLSANMLQTAHAESEKKSVRLKSAWENKRDMACNGKKKMTSMCPNWLEPIKDDEGNIVDFKVLEVRAIALRKIFQLKKQGFGNTKITKLMNEDSFWAPARSKRNKSGGWRESYIQKIIHNRAVIGEFQPHKFENGKRKPIGEPIEKYYPPVIDKDLFDAVQNRLQKFKEKYGHKGGRTGKADNLFSKIAVCGKCGGVMHFQNKGNPPKGGKYLRCDIALRRVRDSKTGIRLCNARAIRYKEFERLFIEYIDELDLTAIIPDATKISNEVDNRKQQIDANEQRVRKLKTYKSKLLDIDNLADSSNEDIAQALVKANSEMESIQKQNKSLNNQIKDLQKQAGEFVESKANISQINEMLEKANSEQERIEFRTRLRSAINDLVEKIIIYPLTKDYVKETPLEEDPYIIQTMHSRYIEKFRVKFSGLDNNTAVVYLTRYMETEHPLDRYKEEIEAHNAEAKSIAKAKKKAITNKSTKIGGTK